MCQNKFVSSEIVARVIFRSFLFFGVDFFQIDDNLWEAKEGKREGLEKTSLKGFIVFGF